MKIDINNNISHQLLTLIITFLLGISIASNLYLNYHKNINTLDNKLENSLIKDKLIIDLLYLSQMENNISNNFKMINELLNHDSGDLVLSNFGKIIRSFSKALLKAEKNVHNLKNEFKDFNYRDIDYNLEFN